MAVQVLTPASVSTGLQLLSGRLVVRSAVALVAGNQVLTAAPPGANQVVVNVAAAATWTLPAAASCAGHVLHLVNHGTGTITLSPGVRTANGGALQTNLSAAAATNTLTIVSDGVLWRRIAR